MVRVLSVHNWVTGSEWIGHSGGMEAMMDVHERAQVHGFRLREHIHANAPIICRILRRSHSPGIFYGESPLNFSFTLFLLELIFIIFTIRVVRVLLKPLRQPKLISELIGGLMIGPSMLGRSRMFNRYLFPDNSDFVLENMGLIGFMYFLFLSGVKMDLSLLKRAGSKHYWVALVGLCVPFTTVTVMGFILRSYMDRNLAKVSSIGGVAASLAITSFPVLYIILKELNLLNSEIGRFALSVSIIGDAVGIHAIIAFEAVMQGERNIKCTVWYLISVVILVAFILTLIRRSMTWIVEKTPEGKPVDEAYIVLILLGVMVMGFLTDMFGVAIAIGPLWFGLVIPDGPPLGATLVARSETVLTELLMPCSFAYIGLSTDFFAMHQAGWSALAPLFALALTGYLSKLISSAATAFFLETPFRDSITLGLILNLRGQVEILLYMHWIDKRIIDASNFSMMVIMTMLLTGITTPFISILYDPTKPYMVNKRRTIQHTPPCSELCIVLCMPDQETVGGLISLLEFSYPTLSNPFSVHALYLSQLVGRAQPVFIDHEEQEVDNKHMACEAVHNALKLYQESRSEFVKLRTYTAVAPRRTMYQDICELALIRKAAFIILAFYKECLLDIVGSEVQVRGMQTVNSDVLDHAPCSVGIFYHKGQFQNPVVARFTEHKVYRFAVLFLGGADAREALAYADRMTGNPDILLTVIRFLSHNYEGDNEMEKKLDDGVVTWFWVKNEANERVIYREVVVRNGAETVAAIQAMNDSNFDLWITGRKQGINPKLVDGLSAWSNNHELGIIGDYISSDDFIGNASVLVIQQQILRGQDKAAAAGCVNTACNSIKKMWV